MSSTTYWVVPALYGILAVIFLGLATYSWIYGGKLPKIEKSDLTLINEFGHSTFFSQKVRNLLLKLPVLIRFVCFTSFIGFILSAIALVIQVWQ